MFVMMCFVMELCLVSGLLLYTCVLFLVSVHDNQRPITWILSFNSKGLKCNDQLCIT